MAKAITFPLSITHITDHFPCWKQGETVKFTIFVDGTPRHSIYLTAAYIGEPYPDPRSDYLLWCRDTGTGECSIDIRAFIGVDISNEEANRAVGKLEACTT